MNSLSSYVLDRESIKLDAYRLLCLFYANKEIARQSDPTGEYPDAAVRLEQSFFPREMTRLLLSIAIALRTLDDQMRHMPLESGERTRYLEMVERVNRHHRCMMWDEMALREVCNKIVHATVVEAQSTEGTSPHAYDELMWESWQERHDPDDLTSMEPAALPWEHLSFNVRLGGRKGGEAWWQLLQVPVFVAAVYELLSNRVILDGTPAAASPAA